MLLNQNGNIVAHGNNVYESRTGNLTYLSSFVYGYSEVIAMDIDHNNGVLYVSVYGGYLYVYDLATLTLTSTVTIAGACFALNLDDRLIYVSKYNSKTITVYNLDTFAEVTTFDTYTMSNTDRFQDGGSKMIYVNNSLYIMTGVNTVNSTTISQYLLRYNKITFLIEKITPVYTGYFSSSNLNFCYLKNLNRFMLSLPKTPISGKPGYLKLYDLDCNYVSDIGYYYDLDTEYGCKFIPIEDNSNVYVAYRTGTTDRIDPFSVNILTGLKVTNQITRWIDPSDSNYTTTKNSTYNGITKMLYVTTCSALMIYKLS